MGARSAPAAASWRGFMRDLAVSGGLPWLVALALTRASMALVPALALSSLIPLADAIVTFARKRAIDAIAIVNVGFLLGSIAIALWSGDVHVVLLKGAVLTAIFSLICFGSLFAPRPLMFYLGRQFSTGGDPALAAVWDARLQRPAFRRVIRRMTAVWGAAYAIEVALRVVAAYLLPPMVVIATAPFITYGILAGLIAWTVAYGKAMNRKYSSGEAAAS